VVTDSNRRFASRRHHLVAACYRDDDDTVREVRNRRSDGPACEHALPADLDFDDLRAGVLDEREVLRYLLADGPGDFLAGQHPRVEEF
jgi:hypothetical protein